MRAGPLSDPSVAALLEEGFVCAWEKKGAVVCYRVREAPEQAFKVGGNIMTYVCTPRGEVIHALPGAWEAVSFREQLTWARTLYREMADLNAQDAVSHLRAAHRERPPAMEGWKAGMPVHALLSTQALRPIEEIERPFFETLLGETYAPDKEIVIREVDPSDFKALLASMPRG